MTSTRNNTSELKQEKKASLIAPRFPSSEFYRTKLSEEYPIEVLKKLFPDEKEIERKIAFAPIILKLKGMQEIAAYYKEKYSVDIYPFESRMKNAADLITSIIKNAKTNGLTKAGILFFDGDHAFPIIWENVANKDNLFFLDVGNYLASQLPGPRELRAELRNALTELQIWSVYGARQLDNSSCTIDAMVVLKDGLRIPSFSECVTQKRVNDEMENNIILFYMPEELLKSAQKGSFISQSKADLNKTIHNHKEKDSKGIPTGETHAISLLDFRKKYEVENLHKDTLVFYGTYTLFKSERFKQILKNRWDDKISMRSIQLG